MRQRRLVLAVIGTALAAVVGVGAQGARRIDRQPFPGTVYTMSNAASGNAVLLFDRLADGRLVPAATVPTGGAGTGAGLGSQGALVLTRNERWLLAVNAGNSTLSVFEVRPHGLRLADVTRSGGERPISVTEHRGLVYVVHGGSDTITGFTLGSNGRLRKIDGATRRLSTSGAGPAQIAFTPDGDYLMVTEKNTNKVVTFAVERDGTTGTMQVQDAPGQTPFGFAFGRRDHVFVTEAFGGTPDASATSSFAIRRDGTLTPLSPSVSTGQTAACWAAVTPDGRFVYVTNTGSGSITGYAIDFDGQIELLDDDGRTGVTGDGSTPIDLVITDSGRYLYNLNSGTHTLTGFRVEPDGTLRALPLVGGLPNGAVGLAAR